MITQAEGLFEKRLLNVQEMAAYLSTTPGTLYQWVSQRRIPFVKVGRNTRFDLRAIEGWIKDNSHKPLAISG